MFGPVCPDPRPLRVEACTRRRRVRYRRNVDIQLRSAEGLILVQKRSSAPARSDDGLRALFGDSERWATVNNCRHFRGRSSSSNRRRQLIDASEGGGMPARTFIKAVFFRPHHPRAQREPRRSDAKFRVCSTTSVPPHVRRWLFLGWDFSCSFGR
jgi:hypothetical protein